MTKILAAMTAALMLAACATATPASVARIEVGEPRPVTGMVTGTAVNVTVTNTGSRPAKRIVVGCQFFGADGALADTGTTFFNNLAAGASDTNGLISTVQGVVRSACTDAALAKRVIR